MIGVRFRFSLLLYRPLRDKVLVAAYKRAGIERISGVPSLHDQCLKYMDDDCKVPVRFALDLKAKTKRERL
jgi:hypothetical protein